MKIHIRHKHNFTAITISLFFVVLIAVSSLVVSGQLTIPRLTEIVSINIIDKGERDDIAALKSTKTTANKPAAAPKITTRTERDEDLNGRGMNTKIITTVTTKVDESGNKTTSTEIISSPVDNKGIPTQPTNSKTTIIKEEPADGSKPKITAVTERVALEKTDDGFITRTTTTTTDVPTQKSTTEYTTSENFTTKEKTDDGFITNNLTITRDGVTGDIVADKTTQTSTIQNTISSVEKTDDGFIRTNTTITRDANTGNIVDAYSVTSTPTPKPSAIPKPSGESTSFWDTVSDKLNNSEELAGLGTYGLGGGNAPVVTPPMSVITSENPQDLIDFSKGVLYSMGGGAVAGTVLVGGALVVPQIVALAGAGGTAVTGTSLAQATAAYGGAAIATTPLLPTVITYGSAALTVGGTAAGAIDCQFSGGSGELCTVVREGLVTGYMADPIGTTELYSQSIDTLITNPGRQIVKTVSSAVTNSIDNQFLGLDMLDPNSIALIGDKHADLSATQTEFWQQGVIDEYGRVTGRKFIDVGDYFGKNTNLQTSSTPGLDVLEWVTDVANRTNAITPGGAVQLAGNWEPRTTTAVVAYLNGDEAVLKSLLRKRLGLEEIEKLASNPEKFAQMLEGLDYVSLSGGALSQHVDTPELARLSFTQDNLTALRESHPELASEINSLIDTTQNNAFSRLTSDQLNMIKEAQEALKLNPTQIANNINSNAHNITTSALLNPSDELAIQELSLLNNIIDADISFYGSNRSALLRTYVGDIFQANTLIHGHTPASALVSYAPIDEALKAELIASGYAGIYTDAESGITMFNVDKNLSSGMRVPFSVQKQLGILKGLPDEWNGVTQLPLDAMLENAFAVPSSYTPIFNP